MARLCALTRTARRLRSDADSAIPFYAREAARLLADHVEQQATVGPRGVSKTRVRLNAIAVIAAAMSIAQTVRTTAASRVAASRGLHRRR